MKKIIAIAFCFVVFMAVSAQAQQTHHVNHRESHQRYRIHQGVVNGSLTHREASKLRFEQRHIRKYEQCAKADGRVSPRERARLSHMQNYASRDIHRQKHDIQRKPKVL